MVSVVKSPGEKSQIVPPPPWTHTYEEFLQAFPSNMVPRDAQLKIFKRLNDAFKNGKRFVVVEAATGLGKSHVAKAAADVVVDDGGAFMITAQIALQLQYQKDFPPPQMELLKGRAHYACTHPDAEPDMHAGDAICHKSNRSILPACVNGSGKELMKAISALEASPSVHRCPYWEQLQKCADSKLTLFNFSSFLFQKRIGRFPKRALLLLDEGHNIEQQLMSFVNVELTEWTLDIIGITIDRNITSKDQFVEWLREKEVQKLISSMLGDLDDEGHSTEADLRDVEKKALIDLDGKLKVFLRYLDQAEWIIDTVEHKRYGETRKKVRARPLFVKEFAQDLLFQHADRVVIFSATVLNVPLWARNLGIDPNEVEHIELGSDFPVENRAIHLEFCGNMGMKHFTKEKNPQNPTQPKFVKKVKQLLKRHEGQRGLIHCHSFALSKVLREEVADPRFLFQDQFNNDKQAMIAAHAERVDSVIVAPAIAEGYDFKNSLARFQIIAKVPWPSLGDKIIKERTDRDDTFFGWCTALKLVQSYGRIVRSKDDWGYTYIVDSGFSFFFSRHSKMIPKWVKDAISRYAPRGPVRQE